ncbi:MAG: ABC transporter ATP-binding protein [Aeromicrobium sp.]|uniref:ABC transporter ATP-binding protein n=1 Tax=Aeromicrobium sp. TaxID=1871063 RepID=UPI003C6561A8
MSGLQVRGVRKSFGDVLVLDGLDLDVARGDVVAALGPSGGGKTTLLRVIAGFLDSDAGDVSFNDTPFITAGVGIAPQQRHIGYVPQEGALFPHLDVRANIVFGLARAERRSFDLAELMRLVDLPVPIATRFPHELSGGQQQRVALARALAPGPDLVLLDEPFSSLDAGLRVETGEAVMRALRTLGATAVMVTHDQGEALALTDQVAIIRDGRVVQTATPTDLYRSPADVGVASFIGDVVHLPAYVSGGMATCGLGDVTVGMDAPAGHGVLLVRPENLRLVGVNEGTPAIVAEVRFFGHDALVRLVTDESLPLTVRVLGSDAPLVGSTVGVSLTGSPIVFGPSTS